MKLSVFCGLSVDGFMARPDDTFDFLNTGDKEPHGFNEFLATVDVVVMCRRTLDVVLKLGHLDLYGAKPVIVLSGRPAQVKNVYEIALTVASKRTPMNSRDAPEFRGYCKSIWEDLDIERRTL